MAKLNQLAINSEGFVFNPSSGDSYTLNSTGLTILHGLRDGKEPQAIAEQLCADFEVTAEDAERDVADFMNCLKNFRLL